jgi:hypothetical protein
MQTKRKRPRHLLDDYVRVNEKCSCPKCGRADWCLLHKSGRKVICSRVKSGKPKGEAGWLHYIGAGYVMPEISAKEHEYLTTRQVQEYLDSVTDGRNFHMIEKQAKALGLSAESVMSMRATYDQNKAVVVFPMFNERKAPTGCRFRRSDGKKYSLTGGQEGVFLSRDFSLSKPIIVAEGPTDAAAACEIGFNNVIGRPNCSGGAVIIKRLVGANRRTPIIVISDPDECGTDGATALAQSMTNPIIVLVGPCDLREFATKRLPSDCRQAILKGLTGDEVDVWRPAYRNMAGQFFDFVGALQRYTCLKI